MNENHSTTIQYNSKKIWPVSIGSEGLQETTNRHFNPYGRAIYQNSWNFMSIVMDIILICP